MARKSFWQRITETVRRIVVGPSRPPAKPKSKPKLPVPVPGPVEPPKRKPVSGIGPREPYKLDIDRARIWAEETDNRTGHTIRNQWDVFTDTGIPIGRTNAEVDEAWRDFIRAFDQKLPPGEESRRNRFYSDYDISARLIDWEAWDEDRVS